VDPRVFHIDTGSSLIQSPLSDLDENGRQFRHAFKERYFEPVIPSFTTGVLEKEAPVGTACFATMARAHNNTTAIIRLTGTDRTSDIDLGCESLAQWHFRTRKALTLMPRGCINDVLLITIHCLSKWVHEVRACCHFDSTNSGSYFRTSGLAT
jgi:hypothetical protein